MTEKKVILLVGMINSPHFQRWLSGVAESGTAKRLYIFPSDRYAQIPDFYKILDSFIPTKVLKLPIPSVFAYYVTFVLDTFFGKSWRSKLLLRAIRRTKPQILHFHETQHGAYLYNSISEKTRELNTLKIVSTWGSDLTIFSKVGENLSQDGLQNLNHVSEIKKVLAWADVLTAEREFEELDARRLGFERTFIAPVYITVGFQDADLLPSSEKPSFRKQIMIKGYQHDAGRALNALEALAKIGSLLSDYQIVIYSASESVRIQAELFAYETGVSVRILPRVPHKELLAEFAKSRIYIGLSTSDGLSTSMVEAMSVGCFPIQSENSAASLFLDENKSGFIVQPWGIDAIAERIKISLENDKLVDDAVEINLQTLRREYSHPKGVEIVRKLYSIK